MKFGDFRQISSYLQSILDFTWTYSSISQTIHAIIFNLRENSDDKRQLQSVVLGF